MVGECAETSGDPQAWLDETVIMSWVFRYDVVLPFILHSSKSPLNLLVTLEEEMVEAEVRSSSLLYDCLCANSYVLCCPFLYFPPPASRRTASMISYIECHIEMRAKHRRV